VEAAAFLHAVERDVGIVEINHDLARRALMGLDEQIDNASTFAVAKAR
jgi:hypothetical protein